MQAWWTISAWVISSPQISAGGRKSHEMCPCPLQFGTRECWFLIAKGRPFGNTRTKRKRKKRKFSVLYIGQGLSLLVNVWITQGSRFSCVSNSEWSKMGPKRPSEKNNISQRANIATLIGCSICDCETINFSIFLVNFPYGNQFFRFWKSLGTVAGDIFRNLAFDF